MAHEAIEFYLEEVKEPGETITDDSVINKKRGPLVGSPPFLFHRLMILFLSAYIFQPDIPELNNRTMTQKPDVPFLVEQSRM